MPSGFVSALMFAEALGHCLCLALPDRNRKQMGPVAWADGHSVVYECRGSVDPA